MQPALLAAQSFACYHVPAKIQQPSTFAPPIATSEGLRYRTNCLTGANLFAAVTIRSGILPTPVFFLCLGVLGLFTLLDVAFDQLLAVALSSRLAILAFWDGTH